MILILLRRGPVCDRYASHRRGLVCDRYASHLRGLVYDRYASPFCYRSRSSSNSKFPFAELSYIRFTILSYRRGIG